LRSIASLAQGVFFAVDSLRAVVNHDADDDLDDDSATDLGDDDDDGDDGCCGC